MDWKAPAVMFLLVAVAGCSEPPAEDAGPTEPGIITDPKDLGNATGSHVHDYWGGSSELEILDARLSSSWNNLGGSESRWRRYFTPPDEHVVPQGTARLTVTVDWTDQAPANSYGTVSLWVKPANTVDHRLVQEIQRGSTVDIPVDIAEADLPHQLLSAWEFAVQYNGSANPHNLFVGVTNMKVVAHRGHELVPFPAHPDQWRGTTQLEFARANGTFSPTIGYTGSGSLPIRIRPQEGMLVPADASHVAIELRMGPELPVGRIELSFHAADTRNLTILVPESAAGNVAHFDIPIEPGMGDGPYGAASLWEFILYVPSGRDPADPALYGGTYELSATAFKSGV